MQRTFRGFLLRLAFFAAAGATALSISAPSMAQSGDYDTQGSPNGPIRLRQPQSADDLRRAAASRDETPRDSEEPLYESDEAVAGSRDMRDDYGSDTRRRIVRRAPTYKPGEFERYIQKLTRNPDIRRFGADLVLPQRDRPVRGDDASRLMDVQDFNPVVPADYVIAPGDEVVLTMWGSVDADLRLTVDRAGRVNIPRIGSVMVAGTRYADLREVIDRQARKLFRNYEMSVSLGQLRGVRVFVTGFATRPGVYSVSSLSTLSSVLLNRAGGPSAAGSFRDIELRRHGRVVARLDLYDLLLTGSRQGDDLVQADDVIHVGPVGKQVALIGSVNKPAIFELREGDTVGQLIGMGGGFSSVADRGRVAVERLDERSNVHVRQIALPAQQGLALDAGDVVRAFSAIESAQPQQRQNKRVRIDGEVLNPGDIILPAGSTLRDAVQAAGGLTPQAFPFGTELDRESVRKVQQEQFNRVVRDLEVALSKRASTRSSTTTEETPIQAQRELSTERVLERLRRLSPSGRVVLPLSPSDTQLPGLPLEDGDTIHVPAVPSTVGVFGSVFNAGTYLYTQNQTVEDYLRQAGSATRSADTHSTFVVRANGGVAGGRQGSWFGLGGGASGVQVLPGDTVIVPEDLDASTFLQSAKDWTQVIYQLGLGVAAFNTLKK